MRLARRFFLLVCACVVLGSDLQATAWAQITITPSSLSWGAVAIGNAGGPKPVTLANTATASIAMSTIAFSGTNPGDFAVYQKTCGASLAASSSCTITVLFRPTAPGTRTATLTITDAATNSPQNVSLTGLATGSASGNVTVSPAGLSFGNVVTGSVSVSQTITISNTTSAAVTLSAASITGGNAGSFASSSTTCGSSLAASRSCAAYIVFQPSAVGPASTTWSILSSHSASPLPVNLSGTGVAPSAGTATVSPGSVSWSVVNFGNAGGPKSITLTNNNSSPIAMASNTFSGTNPADFTIYKNTCGSSLAGSSSCTLTLLFKPTGNGTRTATLSITDNATNSPQQISLTGIGANAPTSLTISPATVTLSQGATQQFTASASATWSATCGAVTSAGLYTSPLVAESCAVKATPTAGGTAATAAVTVTSPITITPASATTAQNATQQFTANVAVTWSASCGTVSSTGLFTASGTQGSVCTVLATASSGTAYTATAKDTIGAPGGGFTVSPSTASVSEGATQQFTASAGATWSANCGTVTSAGLYTAPLAPGSCTLTATPTAGGSAATAAVTVTSPISITPSTANLHALNKQTFTAGQAVTWKASCGTVSSSGAFTAPASAAKCTLTATASSGTAYTAVATANVDVVNYTTWKGGGGLTGAQTDELALTPANVSSSAFGILWTASMDGWVTAQPLYMNGLVINGVAHNVVFVCTNNDTVYAFDGDTGAQLWKVSLIPSGAAAVTAAEIGYESTQQQFGILSTPVIDPTTNTMYVVTETAEPNAFPLRLHALNITTGAEKFGGPVTLSNPQLPPVLRLQRTGLLLSGGVVYVGTGALQDKPPFNGLLFGFNAATLAEQSVWVTTPTGFDGGVWMGGAAPSVDENGDIYVVTGNGAFDGASNFGEAAVKLSPSLQVLDYFAPYNSSSLTGIDSDLGSGDAMLVPDQNGSYPHEMIVCGKPAPIYVLNRDSLGHVGATDNVIQEVISQVGVGGSISCLTAPAMWGQNVYFGGKGDVLKIFTLNANTGMLSTAPVSQGSLAYGYPGADPVISANGNTNGIVWTVDTNTNTLRANDATNLSNALFSGLLSGAAFHWVVPTVVNGHVYVGGEKSLFAFGLKQ